MMTAESLIVALEALPLGEPWAAPLAAAESAIAAARAIASATLFPTEIAPTTADAIAEYTWRTSRLGATGYGDRIAEMHGRALASHPELARLLRSLDAFADVEAAAAQLAFPVSHLEAHVVAQSRAAAEARRRYAIEIAQQLAELDGHELAPAARALLAADALAVRLAAAKVRLEENARAELALAEAERRAAARAVIDRTVERVREAERVAADARAKAALSAEEYRRIKAEALVERLRLSGLERFRVGGDGAIYAVADLISTAHGMTVESLARYEAALAAHEATAA